MNLPTESNTPQHALEELARRLAVAEQLLASTQAEIAKLRRGTLQTWRARVCVVALCGMVAFAVMMFGRFDTTFAQESGQRVSAPFEVVGSDGQMLFRVKDFSDGPQACLKSSKGFSCLAVTAVGGLVMTGQQDLKPKASLGVDNNGDGGLIIRNAGGEPMADILVGPKGGRGLAVYDRDGHERILISTTSRGSGQVMVQTGDKIEAAALFADDNNSGVFVSDPASGARIAALGLESPTAPEGQPPIPAREGLAVLGMQGDPVAAVYLNHEGNGSVAVWKAGGGNQNTQTKTAGAALGVGDNGPVLHIEDQGASANLGVPDTKPELDLTSSKGTAIVSIKESTHGTGYLALHNSNGDSMIEAGVDEKGVGMVRAYPWNPINKFANFGLPGSEIKGQPKGGEGGSGQ